MTTWCAYFVNETTELDVLHTVELCIWLRKLILCGEYYNVDFFDILVSAGLKYKTVLVCHYLPFIKALHY